MKTYKIEWNDNDFNKVNKAIKSFFGGKTLINHRNEKVYFPGNFYEIEKILGLPYTSTSMCPMYSLDCNVQIYDRENPSFYYSYVVLNDQKDVVIVAMDEKENEKYFIV
jgi:hypothetical protein